MGFYHAVFKISYEIAPGIQNFITQNEVEFGGHAKVEPRSYHCLAPSQEIAETHFRDRLEFEIRTPGYQFKLLGIERITLDACIIATVLS